MSRKNLIGLAASLALLAGSTTALAQVGTAFTYQGQLKDSGVAVNAPADFQFSLWTAAAGGAQIGSTVTSLNLAVNQGLFTNTIDFGVNPYTADQALYLQISVRTPAGSGSYTPMGARQKLTGNPFSMATRGVNVNANGRVGIMTQPVDDSAALTLGTTGGAFPASSVRFRGDNGRLWDLSAFTGTGSNFGDLTLSRSGTDFPFVIRGDTSNMLLNSGSAGNVGIGTATPTGKLQVQSGGAKLTFNDATWAPSAGGSGLLSISDLNGADRGFLGVSGNSTVDTVLTATGGGTNLRLGGPAISFFTGSNAGIGPIFSGTRPTAAMFLDGGGSLGIGTITPGARLHVKESANSNGIIRVDSGSTAPQYSIVGFADRGTQIWSCGLRPDGMFGIDRDGINTMLQIDQSGRIGMGGAVPIAGRQINVIGGAFCTGSVWTNACDKNLKEDFVEVNPAEVLNKVANMHVTTWRYKGTDKVHMGPTAQDFRAAFGLGENDTSIGTVDADGVSLAAIKGLNAKLDAKEVEVADLKARLEKLEALMSRSAK